jgi:hypothetical protein
MSGLGMNGQMMVGTARVMTTSGRGLNADELTTMAMDRIMSVADTTPPAIKDQALAFRGQIAGVVHNYIAQAQRSERTTMLAALERAGEFAAAEIIRKL